jgi:uncharacterized protein (DUF1015 family)
VAEVACVPYDVIDTAEARALAEGKPLSFLHVIRPEIDLPEGTDEHAAAVYARGAENLRAYAASAYAVQEEAPALYIYRLVMDGRAQTGIFGCVSVAEYNYGTILKHEKTRPSKEDDRTRHIVTQRAHAEPVMLTFRDDEGVGRLIEAAKQAEPVYDFPAPDGIRHTVWKAEDPEALVRAFRGIEKLYVADGHHRCKAASRAAEAFQGNGHVPGPEVAFFPAVLFPRSEMLIMPYNRVIRKLPTTPEAFLARLKDRFPVQSGAGPEPKEKGIVCCYLAGGWHRIELPPSQRGTVADWLDVARLSESILEPMLDITDVRTDPNIDFVGGMRGTEALKHLVDDGRAEMALSMYATSIQELIDVSDAGLLMPPKSTWFEPKLRSGLLVHLY